MVVSFTQKDKGFQLLLHVFFSSCLTYIKAPSPVLILEVQSKEQCLLAENPGNTELSVLLTSACLYVLKNWIRKWECIVLLLFFNGNISENKSLPPPFFCEEHKDNSGRITAEASSNWSSALSVFWFPNGPSSPKDWDEMGMFWLMWTIYHFCW